MICQNTVSPEMVNSASPARVIPLAEKALTIPAAGLPGTSKADRWVAGMVNWFGGVWFGTFCAAFNSPTTPAASAAGMLNSQAPTGVFLGLLSLGLPIPKAELVKTVSFSVAPSNLALRRLAPLKLVRRPVELVPSVAPLKFAFDRMAKSKFTPVIVIDAKLWLLRLELASCMSRNWALFMPLLWLLIE